jgi:hypothetical protein
MVESSSSNDSIIAKNFEYFLAELKTPEGWTSDTKKPFYELFVKEAVPVNMVKVTGVFNVSAAKIKDVLFDPACLTKYDDTKESRQEMEVGSNYKIFLTKGGKIFMVDPRDTVLIIAFKVEADGTILIAGSSIEHINAPAVKGRIRAQVDLMGYLLEPVAGDANKCKFTHIGKMNPKGSVPSMIINKMIRRQGEMMEKLDKVASKY